MIRILRHYGSELTHNDEHGESEIRKHSPKFFSVKFGKRESFTYYRGGIIASYTVMYSNGKKERHFVPYLLVSDSQQSFTLCLGRFNPKSVGEAKRVIDTVLETGILAE